MRGRFLPKVEVTTIVWAGRDKTAPDWECALGDDLKLNRPTIELDLTRITKRCNYNADLVTQEMIKHWIAMQVIFGTRQELINKNIRGYIGSEGEDILCKANFDVIRNSPASRIWKEYKDMAAKAILKGTHYIHPANSEIVTLFKDVKTTLAVPMLEEALEKPIDE